MIDFGDLIRRTGLSGELDPNSIHVLNASDGSPVAHATTDDFAYGDKGRIEWVISNPAHTEYDIRFSVEARRPALKPQDYVPPIGVGDVLRYNAGVPRPIAVPFVAGLVDLTGDGRADLVGCWNYAYRPGDPGTGSSATRASVPSTSGSSVISCACVTSNAQMRRTANTSRIPTWRSTSPTSIAMAASISSGRVVGPARRPSSSTAAFATRPECRFSLPQTLFRWPDGRPAERSTSTATALAT